MLDCTAQSIAMINTDKCADVLHERMKYTLQFGRDTPKPNRRLERYREDGGGEGRNRSIANSTRYRQVLVDTMHPMQLFNLPMGLYQVHASHVC